MSKVKGKSASKKAKLSDRIHRLEMVVIEVSANQKKLIEHIKHLEANQMKIIGDIYKKDESSEEEE